MPPGASRFLAHRLRDLAWACGFSALLTPPVVYSLALDEISVSSRLGQPLQAVIPVSASAGEALDSACFSVAAPADAGLPGVESVQLHLDHATGQLTLRSLGAVREPMSEITIRVRCQGAPALDRTFLLVLDPPDMQAESVFARADTTPGEVQSATDEAPPFAPAAGVSTTPSRAVGMPQPQTVATTRAAGAAGVPPRRTPRPASIAPTVAIPPGSEYLTQVGDTLSGIAERVSGRPVGSLWAVAKRIHAQNPMAFRDDNPDRLIAGVTIAIPAVDSLAADGFVARTTSFAHMPALPARERDGARSQSRFILSTALSQDSMDKLQVHGAAARLAADARFASVIGTRPEEPVAVRDDVPVPTEGSTDEDEIESAESDELTQSGADDGVDRYVRSTQLPDDAPAVTVVEDTPEVDASESTAAPETVATASPVVGGAPSGTELQTDTATHGSAIKWTLWVLATLFVVGLVGGLLTLLFQLHRRAAARRHAQSQRRASGLERTIRLDHGIIVKEHPVGTPLTVDASTTEIAAIRLAHRTMKTGIPIAALDLELPDVADSPSDSSDVATEVMEAPTQRLPLADSRQFHVDTDLLALAYNEDRTAEPIDPPLHAMTDLPMFPPTHDEASDSRNASQDADALSVDDTALALWEIREVDDEDTMPNTVAVARATKNR